MSDTKQSQDGQYTLTGPVRMPFHNLITPTAVGRKGKAKGGPKFSGTFLIDPMNNAEGKATNPDLVALKAKAAEVARAKWPGRNLGELKFPFSNGDKRAEKSEKQGKDGSFFRGMVVLDARSKFEPTLAVIEKGKVRQLEGAQRAAEGSKFFYNGCYAVPQVNFVAYEGQEEEDDNGQKRGNPDGVTAYLQMVLRCDHPKHGAGERIGGGNAAEVFKAYAGSVSAVDPTADADDEIPV